MTLEETLNQLDTIQQTLSKRFPTMQERIDTLLTLMRDQPAQNGRYMSLRSSAQAIRVLMLTESIGLARFAASNKATAIEITPTESPGVNIFVELTARDILSRFTVTQFEDMLNQRLNQTIKHFQALVAESESAAEVVGPSN